MKEKEYKIDPLRKYSHIGGTIMNEIKNIYILVTQTETLFSKMIRYYTKSKYNHVSISLDECFNETYSFGRKVYWNPLYAGFVKEEVDGIYAFLRNTNSVIYSLSVTQSQYDKLRRIIYDFKENSNLYRYNLLGVLGVTVNRPINRNYHYFCSQFVATVLEKSEIRLFDKPPALVTPQDFIDCDELKPIYAGELTGYVPSSAFNI